MPLIRLDAVHRRADREKSQFYETDRWHLVAIDVRTLRARGYFVDVYTIEDPSSLTLQARRHLTLEGRSWPNASFAQILSLASEVKEPA